jgi:hypothetical protein
MTEADDDVKFRRELAAQAASVQEQLDEAPAGVRRCLIEMCPCVIGVWPDPDEPCGIDFLVIKGWRLVLQTVAGDDRASRTPVLALACDCAEEAWTVKLVLGDADFDA